MPVMQTAEEMSSILLFVWMALPVTDVLTAQEYSKLKQFLPAELPSGAS